MKSMLLELILISKLNETKAIWTDMELKACAPYMGALLVVFQLQFSKCVSLKIVVKNWINPNIRANF